VATVVVHYSGRTILVKVRDGGGGWKFKERAEVYLYHFTQDGGESGIGWTYSDLWFPYRLSANDWQIAAASAILPLVLGTFRWRSRRQRRRMIDCKYCGYDLTGNTSGTCPECGTPIPQTPRPA
jgi:hypothetical protein